MANRQQGELSKDSWDVLKKNRHLHSFYLLGENDHENYITVKPEVTSP